jgi:biopolymer transport protein ExbD
VVNIDELTLRIRDGLRRGAERKVYINADRTAKYGQIRQVLRAISSAGIENVAFLVYQGEPDKTTSELLDDSRPQMNQRSNAS